MSHAQAGIFVEGSSAHMFMEFTLSLGVSDDALRATLSRAINGLQTRNTNAVWAFSKNCWQRIAVECPAGLRDFSAVGVAPATQRDIFLWLHSNNHSDNIDAALEVHSLLRELAVLSLEKTGFVYHDARDLTGFIDGTENPKGDGREAVALIPDGEPGAGGAYVMSQQWSHQLSAFNQLPLAEQEAVIGRTKADSIELKGDAMPANSHVSRSDVKIDGEAQKLYRRSVPYGGLRENGLFFLAFSRDIGRFEAILASMFGESDDGIRDRLTDFSQALSGSYWFAPSAAALATVAAS